MSQQFSLFDGENKAMLHIGGFTRVFSAAMNRAVAASPHSRQQIVDRMNHLARIADKRLTQGNAKSISIDTLEKWLNAESDYMPSLLAVEVFLQATGSIAPLQFWLSLHNCDVMAEEDKIYRDIGKLKIKRKQDAEKERLLEAQLKESRK